MSFKKNKYVVVKNAITKELALFIYNYFSLKKQVAKTLFSSTYISPFETMFGVWNDLQIPKTYSHYADVAMETLLLKVQPIVEKKTGLKLYPNYSYARSYKKGDILKKHKDRFSCEISTTMNLGGDLWSIYLDNIKINLKAGDMVIYKGNELEHWRNEFKGEECTQVFLHYNDAKTKNANQNMFDSRNHLGLPVAFKKL